MATHGKQVISTLTSDNTLTLEVVEKEFADPVANQVLIRMEAAPINPSDLFLMVMGADLANAQYTKGKFVAPVDPAYNSTQTKRHGQAMPIGNEGAGTVVAAGDSPMAQALIGQTVSCVPGQAYGEYALCDAMMCMPLGENSAEDGASSFVNPMTVLGFAETARRDGAKAMVHCAAASNLGQMLARVCEEDGLGLVNVVRKEEQVEMLRGQGATHVVNSSKDSFVGDLAAQIKETQAFVGFDPIGGGMMTDKCLRAMEQVAASELTEYSVYGSQQPKKMYIYGRLDTGNTILTPSYGFSWTVAGWLLLPFLASLDMESMVKLRGRVLDGLTTTFASTYKRKVNLEEMLTKDAVMDYAAMATGEKYLVTPQG